MQDDAAGRQLDGITYLRGAAALSVALSHATSFLAAQGARRYDPASFEFLNGGVDLFFAISGFLMVYTTRQYATTRLDRREFLGKRLARIGPLYWLITAAVFAAFLVLPSISQKPLDAATFVRSMLFVPTKFPGAEVVSTIISPGWTLCYEMFFYVMFALFVGVNYRKGLAALAVTLVGLCIARPMLAGYYPTFYSNPLMLEFVFGMMIAVAPRARWPLVIIAVGACWLALGDMLVPGQRVLTWGVGAALILWGTVSSDLRRPNRILLLLGDASYSIYLTHMYVVRGATRLVGGTPLAEILILACVAAFGVLTYWIVEKPISNAARQWLRRRSGEPLPVSA